jgi:hypothetical protein
MRFWKFLNRRWGVVGPVVGPDGTTPVTGRQAKTGEANVTQTHGKYYEAASRGVLFAACDQGAGVVVQTTFTTTAAMTLTNPVASQKRLAIKQISIGYFSGTLGAGSFYHGILGTGNTLPSGGTALTATCLDVGNQSAAAAQGVARTGATVVAATSIAVIMSTFAELATTANGFQPGVFDIDGFIVLEPGAQWQLLGAFGAAGTSPKITCGIVWEEIQIAASQG